MRIRTSIKLAALAAFALGGAGCVPAPPSTAASTLTAAPVADAAPAGDYCREYRSTAEIAGAPHEVIGTACRQPDGSWQIVGDSAQPGTAAPGTPPTTVNQTTTYVVPYPGYYGPYWPYYGPAFGFFGFGAGFGFGHHHHHHHHHH